MEDKIYRTCSLVILLTDLDYFVCFSQYWCPLRNSHECDFDNVTTRISKYKCDLDLLMPSFALKGVWRWWSHTLPNWMWFVDDDIMGVPSFRRNILPSGSVLKVPPKRRYPPTSSYIGVNMFFELKILLKYWPYIN